MLRCGQSITTSRQFLQNNRLPDKLEHQAVLAEFEKFEHKIEIQRVDRRLWMVAASVILLAGTSIAFFLFRHIPGGDKVTPGPLAGVQLKTIRRLHPGTG